MEASGYQLRFISISNPGRGLAFDCNDKGEVDVNSLPTSAYHNYRRAQQTQGIEYLTPTIVIRRPSTTRK